MRGVGGTARFAHLRAILRVCMQRLISSGGEVHELYLYVPSGWFSMGCNPFMHISWYMNACWYQRRR